MGRKKFNYAADGTTPVLLQGLSKSSGQKTEPIIRMHHQQRKVEPETAEGAAPAAARARSQSAPAGSRLTLALQEPVFVRETQKGGIKPLTHDKLSVGVKLIEEGSTRPGSSKPGSKLPSRPGSSAAQRRGAQSASSLQ
jgi:hypothetical protein